MMRRVFWEEFCRQDSWLLYNDVGYGVIDVSHSRVVNCGIAEQAMVLMSAGMAEEGLRVYCYSIAPHLIRAWEFVRNHIAYRGRDVVLVGVGVGEEYAYLGHSHATHECEMGMLCGAIGLDYVRPVDGVGVVKAMGRRGPLFVHLSKGGA